MWRFLRIPVWILPSAFSPQQKWGDLGYGYDLLHWLTRICGIGSGNGLVLSGNKPLPEPMLTQIYCGFECMYFINIARYLFYSKQFGLRIQSPGAVSLWRCPLTSIGIPVIKIRQSHNSVMGIPTQRKMVLTLQQGPRDSFQYQRRHSYYKISWTFEEMILSLWN